MKSEDLIWYPKTVKIIGISGKITEYNAPVKVDGLLAWMVNYNYNLLHYLF